MPFGGDGLFVVQGVVSFALGLAALALQAVALIDASRQRADAFPAAGKQTKPIWLGILAVAAAIGFVSLSSPLNIFNLLAVVAAGVYMAGVRPAVQQISGRGSGSGSGGPYGW